MYIKSVHLIQESLESYSKSVYLYFTYNDNKLDWMVS